MFIQGWTNQPSLEELQNFLTNQEALLQESSSSPAQEAESVLLFKGKTHSQDNKEAELKRKSVKCYRSGRPGHITRNCRTKLSKVNAAYEENEDYLFESFRWKGWTKGDTNKLHRLPKGIDLRLRPYALQSLAPQWL